MTESKKPTIEFAPGCFDSFEGTQEELDQMVSDIMKMFEGKTIEEISEESRELTEDEFNELPDEVKAQLASQFLDIDLAEEFKRKLQ